jgi:hypothetical protein
VLCCVLLLPRPLPLPLPPAASHACEQASIQASPPLPPAAAQPTTRPLNLALKSASFSSPAKYLAHLTVISPAPCMKPPHHALQYHIILRQPRGPSSPSVHPSYTLLLPSVDPSLHRSRLTPSVPRYLIRPVYTRHTSHGQHGSPGWARTNQFRAALHHRDHHRSPRPCSSSGRRGSWSRPVPAGQSRKTSTVGPRVWN